MQGFSPVASNKLYIQIYNQLHDAIISGRFQVGDKLPSEKELCQAFNVSRVPVREALCALELNGLVDSIQGGGVYVKAQQTQEELPQIVEPQEIIRARMVLLLVLSTHEHIGSTYCVFRNRGSPFNHRQVLFLKGSPN